MLPNCCELNDCKYEDIRVKYKIDNQMKCILYFGRVMKEKGLDILIKAFSKLPEGKFFLLVVGDGPFLDSCKGLARKLGLVNIHFAGSINPQIRKNYFQQCDIFVLPGTYYKGWVDVWGLTIGEAIQFDKIVISTYGVGSAIDLIKNGLNGFIVQPENVKELVESIERSEFISERSIEKVDKEIRKIYSAQNLASNYLECVRESCEK